GGGGGGGQEGGGDGARLDGVESEPERRGAAAEGAADVGGKHAGWQIHHGGEDGRARLLRVRRRGGGKEAGADGSHVALVERAERRLDGHGQAVLVVVGHRALPRPAHAPDGAEGVRSEAITGHVSRCLYDSNHGQLTTSPFPLSRVGERDGSGISILSPSPCPLPLGERDGFHLALPFPCSSRIVGAQE